MDAEVSDAVLTDFSHADYLMKRLDSFPGQSTSLIQQEEVTKLPMESFQGTLFTGGVGV